VGRGGGADFAFPEDEDAPSGTAQSGAVAAIAGDVAGALGGPEIGAGGGDNRSIFATVTVPEAAVHEDDGAEPGQHDVRASGEVFAMQAEAVAEGVEGGADTHFGLRIGGADGRHVARAGCGAMNVSHKAVKKRSVEKRSVEKRSVKKGQLKGGQLKSGQFKNGQLKNGQLKGGQFKTVS
jgi:hypothetical protein